MTLFDGDDGVAAGDEAPRPPDLATAEQVRLLEGYNYRREAVRKWTAEHAATVLNSCKKEEAIALRRAAQKAREQDGEAAQGGPSLIERVAAADYIEQSLRDDTADDRLQCLRYSTHCLTDGEVRRLMGYVVRLYRGADAERKVA